MTPAGIEPATFRIVAQHLNQCATAVPAYQVYKTKFGFYKSVEQIRTRDTDTIKLTVSHTASHSVHQSVGLSLFLM